MNNNQTDIMQSIEKPNNLQNKQTHVIDGRFTVERTIARNEDGIEVFEDELLENGQSVLTTHSMETEPGEIIAEYEKVISQLSSQEMATLAYKRLSPSEKRAHWTAFALNVSHNGDRMSGSSKIDLAHLRKHEPNIDVYIVSMVRTVAQGLEISEEEAIAHHFIIDETAKQHMKTDDIGVPIENTTLAEKVGDLFYDSLSNLLKELSERLEKEAAQLGEIGEIDVSKPLSEAGSHLKASSAHIQRAWEICLPFVGENFPNTKHTYTVKEAGVSNLELAIRLASLKTQNLAEFLQSLSAKIHKDGLADEARGRKKLSEALFGAAGELEKTSSALTTSL